jgi:hypothetical protein
VNHYRFNGIIKKQMKNNATQILRALSFEEKLW